MLRKVFICGAHSTGKTTLFESLKKQLQIQNVKLIYFPEVARKLAVEKNFKAKDLENMDCIKELALDTYDDQIKQEQNLQDEEAENNAVAIFDRCLIDTIATLELIYQKSCAEYVKRTDASKNVECLREESCLVFVTEPVQRFFKHDGLRPENSHFSDVQLLDKKIRDTMKSLQISFLYITMEDLQERTDFIIEEVLKRWPDLKRVNSNSNQNGV